MPHDDLASERRGFLRSILGAVSAAGLAGAATSPPLTGSTPAYASSPSDGSYKPNYFNDAEWRFINAAVDRLIPANEDGPGGLELQVPQFIDRQMDTEYGHGGMWYLHGPFDPDADFTLGYQQRYSPRDFYRAAIPGRRQVVHRQPRQGVRRSRRCDARRRAVRPRKGPNRNPRHEGARVLSSNCSPTPRRDISPTRCTAEISTWAAGR